MNQCPNCGEQLVGDGYRVPVNCMNADIDDWWDAAPDEGPFYCDSDEGPADETIQQGND